MNYWFIVIGCWFGSGIIALIFFLFLDFSEKNYSYYPHLSQQEKIIGSKLKAVGTIAIGPAVIMFVIALLIMAWGYDIKDTVEKKKKNLKRIPWYLKKEFGGPYSILNAHKYFEKNKIKKE